MYTAACSTPSCPAGFEPRIQAAGSTRIRWLVAVAAGRKGSRDLAKATGQPTEGDPELATWALAGAKRIQPPESRGDDVPFGPVVSVPSDSGPYAQLAAWLGRQP